VLWGVAAAHRHSLYLPGCHRRHAPPSEIAIATFSHAVDYSPFYVAKHFGWFEGHPPPAEPRCACTTHRPSYAASQPVFASTLLPAHARQTCAPKAITAIAHKLTCVLSHLIITGQPHQESIFAERETEHQQRTLFGLHARAFAYLVGCYEHMIEKKPALDGSTSAGLHLLQCQV
jgi:hypothetical protein